MSGAADLPDGQISYFPVHPIFEKYRALPVGRNIFRTGAVQPPKGRIAIVTDARLDAMDAAASGMRERVDEWR
jgi:hypothetical protein